MTDKTLGQIAEDAWSAALDGLTESKSGAEARALGDAAWEAAAQAVADEVRRKILRDAESFGIEVNDDSEQRLKAVLDKP